MVEVTERVLVEQPTAVTRRRLEVPDVEGWVGPALQAVAEAVAAAGSRPVGLPFTRCLRVPGTAAGVEAEAGFPVDPPIPAAADGVTVPAVHVEPSRLPGGCAAVAVRDGPYDASEPAREALGAWIAEQGGVPDGPPWERYVTAPVGDPASWRTEIVQPYQVPELADEHSYR